MRERIKDTKSKVTNNTSPFLGDVDGRSAEARRFKDVFRSLTEALGGVDTLSAGQVLLCRKAAGLEVLTEKIESQIANGHTIENGEYSRCVGHLSRILDRLGCVDTGPGEFAPRAPDNADRDPGALDDYLESIGREPIHRPPRKRRAKLNEDEIVSRSR